jgi:Phage gp6-like head-tail connector protein
MPLTVKLVSPAAAAQTGTLTSGSPTVTGLSDTSLLAGALRVTGTGVPAGTLVRSIDSGTQVTLSANATASGAQPLAFALEPVSLAEARLSLRVDIDDDDSFIASLITAARRLCETTAKRCFLTQQFAITDDAFPVNSGYVNRLLRANPTSFQGGMYSSPPAAFLPQNIGVLTFPRAPLVSVDSIVYVDASGNVQTMDPSDYTVVTGSPGRVAPAFGKIWPVTYSQIGSVTYTATFGDGPTSDSVNENDKAAVKLCVGAWYWNREQVSQDGGFATMPMGADHLLGVDTWGGYA